ncbi:MAG: hypothetical protein ACYC4L_20540 [Chloroflexota bacterium]
MEAKERVPRAKVAREIAELMQLLGLSSTEQLAALLRNPGDSYPSGALIRTYRLQRQDAPARFVDLLRARRREVEEQLAEGIAALQIAERVTKVYRVEPKRHVITILSEAELAEAELRPLDATANVVVAALAVPAEWIHTCEICGRPYIARNARSRTCYRRDAQGRYVCRRKAQRLRRYLRQIEAQAAWA